MGVAYETDEARQEMDLINEGGRSECEWHPRGVVSDYQS